MTYLQNRFLVLTLSTLSGLLLTACPPPEEPDPPDLNGGFAYGKVSAFVGGGAVVGAEICMKDSDICGETDDAGEFTVEGLPEDTDVILSFDHRDYFPALGMWNTARKDDAWNYTLPKEDELGLQVSFTGTDATLERGLGQVFFAARVEKGIGKDGVPGIILGGSAELGDIVYGNYLGLPAPDLTETSIAGAGIFVNVEPGEYAIELSGVTGCEPYFSMNVDADGRFPVHVFENALSAVTVVCE
ncbi:MAG: hypothetical protein GY822_10625 [Deltaproteobacteria bacterium]|nr:hypothetical protein [Deltaproteobacteria bacterium]